MGIFFALPNHYEVLLDTIVAILSNSKEVAELIAKSEREQMMKIRSRHADV
jgi:hypothetical protein